MFYILRLASLSSQGHIIISLWEEVLAVCSWRRGHVEGTPVILARIDKAVINQPNLGNSQLIGKHE